MQPRPDITPLLKKLRLSGMLESLEIRNKQAISDKMAYTEFLSLLLSDEVARRDQKKFTSRMRKAGFRSSKTLEEFDFDFNPKIDKRQLYDLATCKFIHEKACVLMTGPCGTGKSHIAQALGHYAVRQGIDVRFTTQSKLLATLHASKATQTYAKQFKAFSQVPLLIMDDFGLKPVRPPHDEDLHDLVAQRYEHASTIITSNLDFQEWDRAFENKLLGSATIDRLRHDAYLVYLDGPSYRKPKPNQALKKEVEKSQKSA
ncbi:IS21-like element helper ATPase IstB [Desulfovermiculus halophilus]|jgi:DNA replication protein DnaC|uniref:IS21-like element helper ATPase IstB n=7 Tax=Desulfovermiculus halophilus TaxID=339722 RepID=UPI00047F81D7|nr:IS21-like element helper ATPase IstB [Desulfovermiculus halophilus]